MSQQKYFIAGASGELGLKLTEKVLSEGHSLVANQLRDPLAPFGGFKQSGVGRKYGEFGLAVFLEAKTVIA